MADQYYDSDLSGQQLDAAFAKMANIDTYVSQAASSASEANGYAETATSAAGQAQTYASQANTAKNNAQTYAGQASDSADSAQTYAGQASGSASAAAASAASIEGDVEAAANSASQAATSASQAAESASDAADAAQTAEGAKLTVQQSASAAQTAATQAAQSAQDAQSAATQASGSASTAQSAATLIEDNLEAIQAAPTNAQAAQTSAQAAEASAAAAEAAADRAEQIADFDPADFATAAQGALAESAVQSVNEKSGTAVTLTPADIGAATAAQGAKADTAVQPATLASYALKSEVPTTPADIGAATAAQGTKADTAVQSVNGKTGTAITLAAADVGAATAAQGSLAETAVQPDALDAYALKTDVPDTPADIGAATAAQGQKADTAVQTVNGKAPNDHGNVELDLASGTVRSVNGQNPDGDGNVTLSASDVGGAKAPLVGTRSSITPSQVVKALQENRQVFMSDGDAVLSAFVYASGIVQALKTWEMHTDDGVYFSYTGIYGYPDDGDSWEDDNSLGDMLPRVTSANNGQILSVQNGRWAPTAQAGGSSGGEVTLIADIGLTSWSQAAAYNSASLATGGYDMVGIVCLCNSSTAPDEYSPIQWFPIPARGQSRKYGLFCMDVNNSPMGEAQVRMISITNNGSAIRIYSDTPGYYYNWGNKGQANTCAVPAFIYGLKF